MSALQIDIGNTFLKWRVVVSGMASSRGCAAVTNNYWLNEIQEDVIEVDKILIASVASSDFNSLASVKLFEVFGKIPWFSTSTDELVGVKNAYSDSSELGIDRWLALVAAWVEFKQDVIIIDSGTALTIDIVNQKGFHLGGYIIPGEILMKRALVADTANLKYKNSFDEQKILPGKTTSQAIKNGIALAQVGAVHSVLANLRKNSILEGMPVIVFCGGGGESLRDLCELESFWRPDLIFEGLEISARELL